MFVRTKYGKLYGAGDYALSVVYLVFASYAKTARAGYIGYCCTN